MTTRAWTFGLLVPLCCAAVAPACSEDATAPERPASSYSLVSFNGSGLPAPYFVPVLNGSCEGEIIRGNARFEAEGSYDLGLIYVVWCSRGVIRMDTLKNAGRYTSSRQGIVITEQRGDVTVSVARMFADGITVALTFHEIDPPVMSQFRAD